jgi:hypothetical protein
MTTPSTMKLKKKEAGRRPNDKTTKARNVRSGTSSSRPSGRSYRRRCREYRWDDSFAQRAAISPAANALLLVGDGSSGSTSLAAVKDSHRVLCSHDVGNRIGASLVVSPVVRFSAVSPPARVGCQPHTRDVAARASLQKCRARPGGSSALPAGSDPRHRWWVALDAAGRVWHRVGELVGFRGLWWLGAGSPTAFRLGRRLQSSIRSRGADQSVVRCRR